MSELIATGARIRPGQQTQTSNGQRQTAVLQQQIGPMVVDIFPAQTSQPDTPILLIHGWGGSGSYWRDTAAVLSRQATVYVPDLPGTGRSQPVSTPQNMFDQVENLLAMLDHFNLQQVQVVGHSMGAAMGILLADKEPKRVEKLVVTSMCFFMNEKEAEIYLSIMKVIRLMMRFRFKEMANIPGLAYMMATRYFYRIPKDKETLQQGFLDYLTLDFETAFASAANATSPEIEAAGARLQAPTLLIACRQDQVMPIENVNYSVEVIPNCELVWIDQCGHLPMVEKPQTYQAILNDFLFAAAD